jgi:predicted membrane channel-forming protein YqfA (hemolysin III family)
MAGSEWMSWWACDGFSHTVWSTWRVWAPLWCVTIYIVFNFFGLTEIQAKFPECCKASGFDLWLSSHQIFHIAVVIAACMHFLGLIKAYSFQHMHVQIAVCPMLSVWKGELESIV